MMNKVSKPSTGFFQSLISGVKWLMAPENFGESTNSSEILQVVYKRHWMPIIIFAGVILSVFVYLLFGKIPVSTEGNAIFLTPGTVVPFQATASGQIEKWHVKVGDYVNKGDMLVELEQPLIEKQLEQAKQKLNDILSKNSTIQSYTNTYTDLEKSAIARKKVTLKNRIAVLMKQISESKKLLEQVYTRKEAYIDQQQKELESLKDLNDQRTTEMEGKVRVEEKMRQEGLRSEDQLLRTRRQLIDQKNRAANYDERLLQAKSEKVRSAESQLETANRIAEQEQQVEGLEHQLQTLLSREAQLDEQLKSSVYSNDMESNDLRRNIETFERQLFEGREIRVDHEGRVLELTAGEGQLVTKGVTLGRIDTSDDSVLLQAVAYFKLKDGKKIKPGMKLRLTPAMVERDRYGSLLTIVRSVSEYPVTPNGVSKTIGNKELATSLTKDDHGIEVFVDLVKDESTFSGYKWNKSSGPKMKVTSGTIAEALADTKEVSPLSFVIPILRDWKGL